MCSPQWSASPPSVSFSPLLLSNRRPLTPLSPPQGSSLPSFLTLPPLLLLLLFLLSLQWVMMGGQQFSSSLSETPRTQLLSLQTLSSIIFSYSPSCGAFMSENSQISSCSRCSAPSCRNKPFMFHINEALSPLKLTQLKDENGIRNTVMTLKDAPMWSELHRGSSDVLSAGSLTGSRCFLRKYLGVMKRSCGSGGV